MNITGDNIKEIKSYCCNSGELEVQGISRFEKQKGIYVFLRCSNCRKNLIAVEYKKIPKFLIGKKLPAPKNLRI